MTIFGGLLAAAAVPIAPPFAYWGNLREFSEIVEKLAVLLWPAIALAALLAFRGPVMRALNRISDSGGAIEVFGVKVDVGKATEEQQGLIEDVQKQIQLLSDRIDALHGKDAGQDHGAIDTVQATAMLQATPTVRQRAHPHVLWVDDHPENNALLAASLKNRGFDIVTVLSTDEGVSALRRGAFNAVISDMGRVNDDDGVTLTRAVRAIDKTIPIFIFCSARAAARFGQQARDAGASVVTDSATVISQSLLALQTA